MTKEKNRIGQRLAALSTARPIDAPPPAPKTRRPQRVDERRPAFRFARLVLDDKSEIPCILKDISVSGARIALEGAVTLPPMLLLKVDQTGERRKAAVVWQREAEAGLSFSIRMS